MPYRWVPSEGLPLLSEAGQRSLQLGPYRSLSRQGFVWFIGATAGLISLPMLSILGSPALWVILPFVLLVMSGVWWALDRSFRDAEIVEVLTLAKSEVRLIRQGPKDAHREWAANAFWVSVILHQTGGPVANYLTLRGGPREVELGAFLSDDERLELHRELQSALVALR
jgi:uncharacterized membrane protein